MSKMSFVGVTGAGVCGTIASASHRICAFGSWQVSCSTRAETARHARGRQCKAQASETGSEDRAVAGNESKRDERDAVPLPLKQKRLRAVLGALSAIGWVDTVVLLLEKAPASVRRTACKTSGCKAVASSPYAALFGKIPLALLGFACYSLFTSMAVQPLLQRDGAADEAARSRLPMIFLSSGMAVFSCYLMYVLCFVIRQICPLCMLSATVSTLLFVVNAIMWTPSQSARDALESLSACVVAVLLSGALALTSHLYISAGEKTADTPGHHQPQQQQQQQQQQQGTKQKVTIPKTAPRALPSLQLRPRAGH
ncbi:hypothetical protein FVE85_4779 [Porphyridium purpureum]|uniref:Vitamin K epoxide reductase domain-containing protein n=1 Tax=Porphyridium purpureum TaxID=35688 RepID=A0A5J4YS30_PORPP|nr:hypothetical protein FVE85_4779 [Porphyridium purpureum]|eukprot:POR3112..scf236_6